MQKIADNTDSLCAPSLVAFAQAAGGIISHITRRKGSEGFGVVRSFAARRKENGARARATLPRAMGAGEGHGGAAAGPAAGRPADLRTADPTVAEEIRYGIFSFDGKTVAAQGQSLFALRPPGPAWRRRLAGFAWLRHLRGADEEEARDAARALVAQFLAIRKAEAGDPAFRAAVSPAG